MSPYTGTLALVRLALRRDRIMLPVWILVFVATAASSASATTGVYPTVESRVAFATTANANPSLVALYGWIYEPTSLGAVGLYKLVALGSALVALLGFLITVRHTRAEEESGRLELIGATVVGRYAALTASLIVSIGASLVLGLLSALALAGGKLGVAGSFAFGLGWAASGMVFAAVAAVAAQLTESARTANGISAAALGVAYVIRAIGDAIGTAGSTWLTWLSPIGWATELRPFAGDRFWVLIVPVLFTVVAVGGAFALIARRDLGQGLVPARLGPARGSVRTAFGLAVRLQRGSLIGWACGFVLGGLVFGGIAAHLGGLVDSPQAQEFITKLGGQAALTDAFLATELSFVGVVAAAFGIQAALRLRTEESAGRAEPILVASVSRPRWLASHLVIALVGSVLMMLAAGVAAGLSYGAQTDLGQFWRLVGGALVQLPAAWLLTGITVAVFGLLPRYVIAGWAALAAFVLIGQFGPVLGLGQAVLDISPFTHIPRLPGTAFTATPLVWLTGLAVATLAVGFVSFRRRDLAS
jgi:ABC-2 type transport system permease protein